MINIDTTGNWKLYWGAITLPVGAEAIGIIQRKPGDAGALLLLTSGNYVQGNAGSISNLDQSTVKKALGISTHGGYRQNSGRKKELPEGARVRSITVTDNEYIKVKEYIYQLRNANA